MKNFCPPPRKGWGKKNREPEVPDKKLRVFTGVAFVALATGVVSGFTHLMSHASIIAVLSIFTFSLGYATFALWGAGVLSDKEDFGRFFLFSLLGSLIVGLVVYHAWVPFILGHL